MGKPKAAAAAATGGDRGAEESVKRKTGKAEGERETEGKEEEVAVRTYEDQAPDRAKTFMQHDFGLDRRLVKAVAKMGFVYPTLVQSKCIPLALRGKDLLVSACSRSFVFHSVLG